MLDLMETAYADQAVEAAGQASAQPTALESMLQIVVMVVVFYFLLIRPQAKKTNEHEQLITNLQPGDEVITSGGIIGRIRNVQDTFVTVDVGGSHLKIVKEHILKTTKELVESSKTNKANAKAKSGSS